MKIKENQQAPAITVTDVFGHSISLPLRGTKVYLHFMRFAGCPVCNMRVHELLKNANTFEEKNIKVVLVYESTKEVMLEYLKDEKFPFLFIADKSNTLYDLYSIEKSYWKLTLGMFRGALGKALSGKKLFKKAPPIDGSVNRIEAEFLIDELGEVKIAHYHRYFGDELNLKKILA